MVGTVPICHMFCTSQVRLTASPQSSSPKKPVTSSGVARMLAWHSFSMVTRSPAAASRSTASR